MLFSSRNHLNLVNTVMVLSPFLACCILHYPDQIGSFSTRPLHSIHNLTCTTYVINSYWNTMVNARLWVPKSARLWVPGKLIFFPISPIHSKELNIYKLFNKFELNVKYILILQISYLCRNHHVPMTFSSDTWQKSQKLVVSWWVRSREHILYIGSPRAGQIEGTY